MGLIRYTKNKAIRKVAMARLSAIIVPLVAIVVSIVAPEMNDSALTEKFGEAIAAAIASFIVWYTAYRAKSSTDDVDPANYDLDDDDATYQRR